MKKPTIWHIAAWWPTKEKPGNGLFIKAHIESVLNIAYHGVIHLRMANSKTLVPKIKIETKNTSVFEVLVTISTPIRRFGILEFLIKRGYKKAFQTLDSSIGKPDLLHFHVRNHISRWAIQSKAKPNVSTVLTEHFSFYHRGINELSETDRQNETKAISDFFKSENLKAIMPVSHQLANVLESGFEADPKKIKVIPNIAEACFYFQAMPSNKLINIVLVAAWNKPKNPFLFFDSLSSLDADILSTVRVDVIGHGRQVPEMKQRASQLNIEIQFHGFKPRVEIAEFLQKADFFCLPTDRENLPTVIAEALSCGCPVLSMDTNGIPEMINEKNGILVEPKNQEALTNGLKNMIRNCHSYDKESIAKAAHEKFASDKVGEQIEAIYKTIMS